MDEDSDSQSLLHSVLRLFARKRPPRPANPPSLRLRHRDDVGEPGPENAARTLHAFGSLEQDDSDQETDASSQPDHDRYPKRRRITDNSDGGQHTVSRASKRRRECDCAIQELPQFELDRKDRRVLPRDEPAHASSLKDPDADLAVLMRRHLVNLNNALRSHWVCVCQKCSGLSMRLPLPQKGKKLEAETSFEVFFGVHSSSATALQEAKITVKSALEALHGDSEGRMFANTVRRRGFSNRIPANSSEPVWSCPPDSAHICKSITESLGQRSRLHFTLQDGMFQRLPPQPKAFASDQLSWTVSLSALFNRQQELLRGESVLPLKGKRILAVTLAWALFPFLETPWLQGPFNHSNIRFFEPRQSGELPDITKPFLALEHIPVISDRIAGEEGRSDASAKHIVHPNASVLALGILLCELHYCTPVELMAKDLPVGRNANDDLYTCLDKLQTLEDDAGVDYYLATKTCLTGEYYPLGQQADFEDVSLHRLFYQNVVKRLEAVIFQSWRIRLENLGSFDSRQNESCWGSLGREVVRIHTGGGSDNRNAGNARTARAGSHPSKSDPDPPMSCRCLHSDLTARVSIQPPLGAQVHGRPAALSGTSVATPIATGLAASVLCFVRQQDQQVAVEGEKLGPWLKRDNAMDAVFRREHGQTEAVGIRLHDAACALR